MLSIEALLNASNGMQPVVEWDVQVVFTAA